VIRGAAVTTGLAIGLADTAATAMQSAMTCCVYIMGNLYESCYDFSAIVLDGSAFREENIGMSCKEPECMCRWMMMKC
jgi:hypothetical protein